MKTVLAISPHLDDAVFSAGGLLKRRACEGYRVVIATVFTASVPDPKGFALACQLDKGLAPDVDYMALRRDEDAVACAVIGAEPVWLPFREAPHRGYHSAAALFDGIRSDDNVGEAIAHELAALICSICPDEILAPRGIGNHVDHLIVARAVGAAGVSTCLWTDYPYSIRHGHGPLVAEDETRIHAVTLTDTEIRSKIQAAAAYTTQIPFQFGDFDELERSVGASGRMERYLT